MDGVLGGAISLFLFYSVGHVITVYTTSDHVKPKVLIYTKGLFTRRNVLPLYRV